MFINYCAAALATVAHGVVVADPEGGPRVRVGALQAGMARSVALRVPVGGALLVAHGGAGGGGADATPDCAGAAAAFARVIAGVAGEAEAADARLARRLRAAIEPLATGGVAFAAADGAPLRAMIEDLAAAGVHDGGAPDAPPSGFAQAMRRDLEDASPNAGQLLKALARVDWYTKWGMNHLVSYGRALRCEQTVNFKDAALQFYAGPLFRVVQGLGNELFDNLPAPTPSISSEPVTVAAAAASGASLSRVRRVGGAPAPAASVKNRAFNMRKLNTASGGCWAGHCGVAMADGGEARADAVRAGDKLAGGGRVRCVVRTATEGGSIGMVHLPGGLVITPWHPVRAPGATAWAFPAVLRPEVVETPAEYVYNLVVDGPHGARVAGYTAATLGHHCTDDNVIAHECVRAGGGGGGA